MFRQISFNLGLIGDNIAGSQAPRLHRLAGELCGFQVSYELLMPHRLEQSFDSVFQQCAENGFRGINITYPYKEKVVEKVSIGDPLIRNMAAVNTVIFDAGSTRGFNTDYSGFVAAYRNVFGQPAPGRICLIGAGGVGKAVAFGLIALGAEEIRIVDIDQAKARLLARTLQTARPGLPVIVTADFNIAAAKADGLINCTPVGMVGHGGTPLPRELMSTAAWAFDVVYTPLNTQFLQDAKAEGLDIMSGYELFFYQGINAFEIFCDQRVDEAKLRDRLISDS